MSLKDKTVLVVGCGGLGGYVIQQLGRMNLGTLIILDGDVFEKSNLNRQLLCTKSNLGISKAQVYADFLNDITDAKVISYFEKLDEHNANLINKADVVIDCVDSVKTRLFLADECKKRKKILIHAGVDGECGQAFICYPDKNTMHDFYANSGEVPHKTISFNVGLAASLETMLAYRVLTNDDEEYKGKIIIFDLPSGLIKVMDI
ncbi:MAG: ThiF family adenylyltransferase [Clostridia bacterium]|nr:ThiF family adenylyltransferase [Clostridia bacterium]